MLGELDHAGELADVGGGPFLHTLVEAVPTVANAAHYAQLVADTARRRRVIDLGIRLAHSDADPAVLAHLAGELADTTAGGIDGRGWAPPVPFGATGDTPAFPVEVLPGWLGEYVAAVATATQTPPDLAGMLALAVLATVAAGAVEVQPRPGWREPLCLFVAVGHGRRGPQEQRLHRPHPPVAEFERQQATAALPAITETITLRRIADQAAAHAEAAASKAPADLQEERQAEAIARAAEAANLIVPPVPRWLVDDATPEALAGLLATYGRIALLQPGGGCVRPDGRPLQPDRRPQPRRLPQRPRRRPAQGRPPRPPPRVRRAAVSDHRPGRAARGPARAGRPARVRRPGAAGPVPVQPPPESGRPPPARRPTRPAGGGRPLRPGAPSPGRQPDHSRADATTRPCSPSTHEAGELLLGFERDLEPRLAADSGDLAHLAGWAAKLAGATCRLAALLHLASHLRDGWAQPISADTFAGAIRLADYLIEHARAVFDLMGADPRIDDARWLLDWITRTNRTQFSRRDAHRAAPRGRFPKATDLEPALRLLEEHGYLRRVDPEPSQDPRGRGRPASPRFLVNPLPRAAETTETPKTTAGAVSVDSVRFCGARLESPMRDARLAVAESSGAATAASRSISAVTLSNENGPSRSRPCPHPPAAALRRPQALHGPTGEPLPALVWTSAVTAGRARQPAGGIPRRGRGRVVGGRGRWRR